MKSAPKRREILDEEESRALIQPTWRPRSPTTLSLPAVDSSGEAVVKFFGGVDQTRTDAINKEIGAERVGAVDEGSSVWVRASDKSDDELMRA